MKRVLFCLTFYGILLLPFLGGCGTTSMQELQDEAMLTGDWSKVEQREKRDAKKLAWKAAENYCRENEMILYCDHKGPVRLENCGCAKVSDIREALRRAGY